MFGQVARTEHWGNSHRGVSDTEQQSAERYANPSDSSNILLPDNILQENASELLLSEKLKNKLEKYSVAQPYTSLHRHGEREKPTDSIHNDMMPRQQIGFCWGGSMLREGASRQILASDKAKALRVAADAYLVSQRQRTECLLWTLPKTIFFPVHLMPLEGALNAHQTKILMRGILRKNGIDTTILKKINFHKNGYCAGSRDNTHSAWME